MNRIGRASLLLMALLLAAAGSGCVSGAKIRADAEVVKRDIAKARKSGAYKCAPRELALAAPSASAAAIEVAFEDHTDYLLMADEQRQFEVPEVSLSATCRAGMLRVDANGQPLACALVEGEGLTLAGRPVEAKP